MPRAKPGTSAFAVEYQRAVEHWLEHPADFVRESYSDEQGRPIEPDPWQVEALEALARKRRVSIRACHGPGKSALDAWAIQWFMSTRYPARVPCTAPTAHQLEDILWAELAKWLQAMQPWQRGLFRLTSERLEWAAAPKESFAVARTARPEQPEALQGFHGANLLFVIDEASGVAEPIFQVATGALSAENSMVLMTANPTQSMGYYYDSHHSQRKRWHAMRVSHADSPRVSDQYVEEMREKWGAESNVFRVRVLGEFPRSDDDAVIPLETIEAAIGRDVVSVGENVWGLDVARFGRDSSALAKASANTLLEPVQRWHGLDTMQVAGQVIGQFDETPEQQRPTDIYVDVIGIGAGVKDRLKELLAGSGTRVHGVNVAERSSSEQRYMRLRDELWFRGREFFAASDCRIPEDSDTIGELSTTKVHPPTSTGKLRVFSKDEMAELGVQSPDGADAFLLTRAHRWNGRRRHAPEKDGGYARTPRNRRQRRRQAVVA